MTFALMPEEVVHRHLDAYNDRDLERFLSFWSPEAEVYDHPSTLRLRGLDALRAEYAAQLRDPDLHAEVLHRRVIDAFVIDQQRVTRTLPEGLSRLDVAAIYQVESSRIRRAWFIVGEPRLSGGE